MDNCEGEAERGVLAFGLRLRFCCDWFGLLAYSVSSYKIRWYCQRRRIDVVGKQAKLVVLNRKDLSSV